jgi:restriction endonuclease S subunit
MQIKIKDIAKIQFGHYSSLGKNNDVPYIQAKHFDDLGQYSFNCDTFLEKRQVIEENTLKEGDVLFVSKGFRFFAAAYDIKWGIVVPSSVFFVLKTDKSKILPEYLAVILNLPQSQAFFTQAASSSTIPSIRKNEIADFTFNLIPLEQQQKIVNLKQLHLKEINLTKQLIIQKQNLFQSSLIQLLNQ